MTTRHNLCINPSVKNNVTGWSGDGGAPTRTTGGLVLGFVRDTVARYTAGSFFSSAKTDDGAVTPGNTYTLSVYLRPQTSPGNGTMYIEWIRSNGTGFGYPSAPVSAPAGQVSRWDITAVAPAQAVSARLIVEGAYTVNTTDAAALLIEEAATVAAYFDGDSANSSWDGADGNSASTFVSSVTHTGSATSTITAADAAAGALTVHGDAVSTVVCADTAVAAVGGADAGSFYPLLETLRLGAQWAREERTATPVACELCGEPLKGGPDGVPFCPFDGWGPGDRYVSDRVGRWGR